MNPFPSIISVKELAERILLHKSRKIWCSVQGELYMYFVLWCNFVLFLHFGLMQKRLSDFKGLASLLNAKEIFLSQI